MTQTEALAILIQSAQLATKRGAFELAETKIISQAVDTFTVEKPEAPQEEAQGEEFTVAEEVKKNKKNK